MNETYISCATVADHSEWVLCPVCTAKTKTKIREDTTLENFPLFCPKCKQETIIAIEKLNIISYQRAGR